MVSHRHLPFCRPDSVKRFHQGANVGGRRSATPPDYLDAPLRYKALHLRGELLRTQTVNRLPVLHLWKTLVRHTRNASRPLFRKVPNVLLHVRWSSGTVESE